MEELKDRGALEMFLSDLTIAVKYGRYLGIDFEVSRERSISGLSMLLLPWFLLYDWLTGNRQGYGFHVKFKEPLGIDLWIESRRKKNNRGQSSSHFNIYSSDSAVVDDVLKGELLQTLLTLDEKSHVVLSDEHLQISPIPNNPAAAAVLVEMAIRFVSVLAAEAERFRRKPSELDSIKDYDEIELTPSEKQVNTQRAELGSTRFEEVYRGTDPNEAELVADLLEQNGLDAQLIGTRNAPVLGASNYIITLRIEVPDSQLEAARSILASFPETKRTENSRDSRIIAALIPIIPWPLPLPGGSHIYARRPWTGAVLALCWILGFITILRGEQRPGYAIILGAIILDIVGGQMSITSNRKGKQVTAQRQQLVGIAMAIVLYFLATVCR